MAWAFKLTDVKTDALLADVTSLVTSARISARLNRPMQITLDMPSNQAALTTLHSDGDPYLFVGTRAIKAYQDGTLRGHCLVWTLSWEGGTELDPHVEVVAMSSLMRLQYANVFDATGHISYFDFGSSIDAGTLLSDAIANADTFQLNQVVGGVTPQIFPIFVAEVATTTNVSSLINDGPMTIGDLLTGITDAGVADFVEEFVDTTTPVTAGIMSRLHAKNVAGSDRSATVHFDYATGSKNVAHIRRVNDATSLGNRIVFEVGPMVSKDVWLGNVSGTEGALATYQTLALASRHKFGTYADTRVYDADATTDGMPFFHELWKTETKLRVNPRELLYMTPATKGDNFAQFRPFIDYGLGDIVAVSTDASVGKTITNAQQRIYGFDVNVDGLGVERVDELITSADAE